MFAYRGGSIWRRGCDSAHCAHTISRHSLSTAFFLIDSCRDELLHHTFIPHPPLPSALLSASSHHSHLCSNKRRVYTIFPACAAVHTLPQAFCQNVQRPPLQTKKLLWMFIMYRGFFPPVYQRLYPSGERSEQDGLWSVHICRPKEEEVSDVSARCTGFMGLHYNPFAPVLFFSSRYCISEVMQTLG